MISNFGVVELNPDEYKCSAIYAEVVAEPSGSVENAECGVRSAECGKCGVWKMRGVENAECGKCGVWKMRGVENAECGKCVENFNFPSHFFIPMWINNV